jgi:hypothetical protein
MNNYICSFATLLAVMMVSSLAMGAEDKPVKLVPVLKINRELDKRTLIKPSAIPDGGDGLFAAVKIEKGDVIGELGGQLRTEDDYPQGNFYVASIPECAWEETQPFKYLDSKHFGGNVSRINFAPSKINGRETDLQNAALAQICNYPYVIFVALKDIEPGTEIWASYGPYFDYEKFMTAPSVQKFFCGLVKIDCQENFDYEP